MSEERNRKWFKWSCLGCLGIPCLSLMLAVGGLKCVIAKKGGKLPEELAKLRKMGIATEITDLTPVPLEENAAPFYMELFADFKAIRDVRETGDARSAFEMFDPESTRRSNPAEVREGFGIMRKFLEKADRVTEKKRLGFTHDYAKGGYMEMPEFGRIKDIARYQSARARLLVQDGDAQGSLKAIRSLYAMSNHLTDEPLMYAGLVGVATDQMAYNSYEKYLERFKSNPAALSAGEKMLAAMPDSFDLLHILKAEIPVGRISIQNLKSWSEFTGTGHGEDRGPDPLDRVTIQDPALKRMFEAKYLEVWRKTYESLPANRKDWPAMTKAMEAIEDALDRDHSVENKVNQVLFFNFSGLIKRAAKLQANRRLALLSTRLLLRRPQGLPQDLTTYGNLAIDPNNGKPMRYAVKGGGFKVWCIGEDGKDHGGKKFYRNAGMRIQETDQVMMFFYPEKPPPRR